MPEIRRIVLVGFMGSGKSAVGRALARRLGWGFVDLDERVEEVEGRTVAAIFAESGEAHFRAAEAREAERALREERVVVAAGGGWAAVPGRLASLPHGTVSVWLRVSPEEAVRRARPEARTRPLLAGPHPVETARELLARRAPLYAEAHLEVDTEGGSVEDVAARIFEMVGPGTGVHPAWEKR